MRKICNLVTSAVCVGSLAACGQTGPLFLPPQPVVPHAPTHAAPATTQTTPLPYATTHTAPAASTARTPAAANPPDAAKATSPAPQTPKQTPPPPRKTR
ncbi:MAG: LPS translocon maturation chaperone LptM [Gammaproteobacteria bacterium]